MWMHCSVVEKQTPKYKRTMPRVSEMTEFNERAPSFSRASCREVRIYAAGLHLPLSVVLRLRSY